MPNTTLELRYVDAGGHKQYETVILSGAITQAQIEAMLPHLELGESVIAHQLGLPTPAENMAYSAEFPTADDHVWTDLAAFVDGVPVAEEMHTDDPDDGLMSVDEFVQRVIAAEWDIVAIAAEINRLGIPEDDADIEDEDDD